MFNWLHSLTPHEEDSQIYRVAKELLEHIPDGIDFPTDEARFTQIRQNYEIVKKNVAQILKIPLASVDLSPKWQKLQLMLIRLDPRTEEFLNAKTTVTETTDVAPNDTVDETDPTVGMINDNK